MKKTKIPQTLRWQVWDKWIENCDGKSASCWCCKIAKIAPFLFHCGHIVAESKGGKLVVENLRPICGSCNSSMGNSNMIEFMKKYGFGTFSTDIQIDNISIKQDDRVVSDIQEFKNSDSQKLQKIAKNTCDQCFHKFTRRESLEYHIKNGVCKKKQKICDGCNREFKRNDALKYHLDHNVCGKITVIYSAIRPKR